MALRLLAVVWQWLPIVAIAALLGVAFGWLVTAFLALAIVSMVSLSVIAHRRGRDLSRLSWPIVLGLMLAAFGALTRDFGVVIAAGVLGLVIGVISEIPLRKRSGELYSDGELARRWHVLRRLFLGALRDSRCLDGREGYVSELSERLPRSVQRSR